METVNTPGNLWQKVDQSPLINYSEDLEANFDLSVIMPFYKKMKEFRRVFPLNRSFFERNGVEVIIVMDSPEEEEELLDYIKKYPFINCIVICNKKPHEWRNPSKPINVGIRFATKRYIMVCSPESEFMSDAIYILRKALKYYPEHYAIGRVCFAEEKELVTNDNIDDYNFIPFGSIMVEKKYLEKIRGYDESLQKWGGDDNNIRIRLEMIGVEELYLPEVILVHRDINNKEGVERRKYKQKEIFKNSGRKIFYPKTYIVNDDLWGTDFKEVIYDYRNNMYATEQIVKYLSDSIFIRCEYNPLQLRNRYPILLLVQTYNESKLINSFLKKISPYFDAIILLDDNSDDNTYSLAVHKKIVLKAQKQRSDFNDLQNRNILLNLASFYNYEFACFMDVDEEIDERGYSLLNVLKDDKADSFMFCLIHLWNNEENYNAEYPYTHEGLAPKLRMFRNIGRAQLYSKRGKLHFHQVPFIGKSRFLPILIKHYGNLTQEMRKQKYLFYKREDTEGSQDNYEHLLNHYPKLRPVEKVSLEDMISIFYK